MAEDPYAANRRNWDERATFHLDTPMYREFVARLRGGGDTLARFDDRVLGDIRDLDVLHLQCHIGTDTLSLVRRGARAVGVDFSEVSIARARALATELAIPARFVVGDVLDLPDVVGGPFDVVYASYGVLCWIGDLAAWARSAAGRLRSGGRLIVIDGHPLASALADDGIGDQTLVLGERYLGDGTAERVEGPGGYADRTRVSAHDTRFQWSHSLGDLVNAACAAGLAMEALHEDPESFYRFSPRLVPSGDGLWQLPAPLHGRYPLTFTLVARRG